MFLFVSRLFESSFKFYTRKRGKGRDIRGSNVILISQHSHLVADEISKEKEKGKKGNRKIRFVVSYIQCINIKYVVIEIFYKKKKIKKKKERREREKST